MTHTRFLAVIDLTREGEASWDERLRFTPPTCLSIAVSTPRLRIWSNSEHPQMCQPDSSGILFGRAFSKTGDYGRSGLQMLAQAHNREIVGSGSFPETIWGQYLAFSFEAIRGRAIITRDPSGGQPCYYARGEGFLVLASDVEDLMSVGIFDVAFDWNYLAGHMMLRDVRPARTALGGVTELLAGFSLIVTGDDVECRESWAPWTFNAPDALILDKVQAVEAVRDMVIRCVAAMCADISHPLLGLSGGLDSSIVAAALAAVGQSFTGLVLSTQARSGDERNFARGVADHLGVELKERFERLDYVALDRSDAGHLPRPVARAFAQSGDRLSVDVAQAVGADAFMSGGGGDNVFCSLQSVIPVADRLRYEGLRGGAWRSAFDVSTIADCTVAKALWRGLRRAYRKEEAYRWTASHRFISLDAVKRTEIPHHPWQDVPAHRLPGHAVHIAWLLGIQNHLEGYQRQITRPLLFPLLSQPLVELCLRIPTWLWCDGGRNRSIARSAFSSMLPSKVIDRRSKGTPDGFILEIVDAHRADIKVMMGDGCLRAEGLLDFPAIANVLDDPRSLEIEDAGRLMALVDIEAWLRTRMASSAVGRAGAAR